MLMPIETKRKITEQTVEIFIVEEKFIKNRNPVKVGGKKNSRRSAQ